MFKRVGHRSNRRKKGPMVKEKEGTTTIVLGGQTSNALKAGITVLRKGITVHANHKEETFYQPSPVRVDFPRFEAI